LAESSSNVFNHIFVDYLLVSVGNQRTDNLKYVFHKIHRESEAVAKDF